MGHSYLNVDPCVCVHVCVCVPVFKEVLWLAISPHLHLPLSLPDMNHLEPTHSELNELPLSLTLNHISLSDMGTPGQTHTASFFLCLSTQINSHSSRALSCLKLQLLIIDHLLPERPQCGIMRIKTRAEKAERGKRKRVEQRRRADTGLIPTPGQNP